MRSLDDLGGAPALPDYRVVDGLPCLPVPEDGGLPLVRDADADYIGGV